MPKAALVVILLVLPLHFDFRQTPSLIGIPVASHADGTDVLMGQNVRQRRHSLGLPSTEVAKALHRSPAEYLHHEKEIRPKTCRC